MLRNYLLLAFKVLQRNKFYTCISLFGIAVTLMVLIIVTSLIDSFVNPGGPERNSERILVGGLITLIQYREGGGSNRSVNPLGYRFVETALLGLQTPELIGVFAGSFGGQFGARKVAGFRNGVKILSSVKRTDANYWKILHFDFLEGRPISEQEHQQGAYVAVISESTRRQYFDAEPAVGRHLTLGGGNFEIIGVVNDVSPLQTLAVSDVWLPIFATSSTQFRTEDRGEFTVLLQARTPADIPSIQQEYQVAVANFQPLVPQWFRPGLPLEVYSWALPKVDMYLQLVGGQPGVAPEQQNIGSRVLSMLTAGMLLFMALPVINLVNINVSRILDRASEIGVRKSFGASSRHLVGQFIVENLVVTLLGGLLGFALAVAALTFVGSSGLLPGEVFRFNPRVFALGLLYIVVFGLLSAVWPAWKMSRLDPVHALKGAAS